jgi:hypothetical protein
MQLKTHLLHSMKFLSSAQSDESQLAPHPHRIRLWGDGPEDLAFPPLCPNCGAAATTRLAYFKLFNSVKHAEDGRPQGYVRAVAKVPYCDECITLHHEEAPPPRTLVGMLMYLSAASQPTLVVAFAGGAIAAAVGAFALLPRSLPGAASLLLLSLLLVLAAFGAGRQAREAREYLRAAPQGGITTAFDFGESTRPGGDSDRFLCTIRNKSFAQEFAKLNSKRILAQGGPPAA